VSNTFFPSLDSDSVSTVVDTITRSRLSKYLRLTNGDESNALGLYVLNARAIAAVLVDLHYVEVALRNKFDRELTDGFGASDWFVCEQFSSLMDVRSRNIIEDARTRAARRLPKSRALPPGKVIAELSFGFWLRLI